jgi:hypothetical protein
MLDCYDIINMREALEEMGQAGRKHLQSVLRTIKPPSISATECRRRVAEMAGVLRLWLLDLAGDGDDGAFIQ